MDATIATSGAQALAKACELRPVAKRSASVPSPVAKVKAGVRDKVAGVVRTSWPEVGVRTDSALFSSGVDSGMSKSGHFWHG